jgi:ribosomal protein L37AE/L43A
MMETLRATMASLKLTIVKLEELTRDRWACVNCEQRFERLDDFVWACDDLSWNMAALAESLYGPQS